MALLVLFLLVALVLNLDMKVAVVVNINGEIILCQAWSCKFYCVVFFALLNVDCWCCSVYSRHKVGIEKVIKLFWHPKISIHYW